MNEKILIVDDEPRVLNGIKRGLHGLHKVLAAEGGSAGLELLEDNADIAIVISDMRMPYMDGSEFLAKVRERYPHVVRMMLTGNNDQATAKKAVNEGAVFRFLNKPCTRESLTEAIEAGLDHFRLMRAEKDVLEQTLGASVGLMADILSMVKPGHFGATGRIVKLCVEIAERTGGVEPWKMRAAATLSSLGYLTVPEAIIEKRRDGAELTLNEANQYREHAAVGARMVEKIPRMEDVANIIRDQDTPFRRSGGNTGKVVPFGARILHAAIEFDLLRTQGVPTDSILHQLENQRGNFDPDVIYALHDICGRKTDSETVERVSINDLEVGMVIEEDIISDRDVLVVFAGQPVTIAVLSHLEQLQQAGALDARPLVRLKPAEDAQPVVAEIA